MQRLTAIFCSVLIGLSAPVYASDELDRLWSVMQMQEFADILAEEGREDAFDMGENMFEQVGEDWVRSVELIYDAERLGQQMRKNLEMALERRLVGEAIDFYESPLGRQVTVLELSARRALLDPEIEAISRRAVDGMQENDPERLDLISRFIVANDLVDNNVAGTMNGNYAFLSTLADMDLGPFADDREAILSVVWSQEEEVRAETETWLTSYFAFAFDPLSDDDLENLISVSGERPMQRLNAVLFEAFDGLFNGIAVELALAAGQVMLGEDL